MRSWVARAAVSAALMAGLTVAVPVTAQVSMDARIQRLERLVGSEAMVQLLENVDQMRRELRELRGQIERQAHTIEQLRRGQRAQYQDLEKRIAEVEAARTVAAADAPEAAPAAPAAAPEAATPPSAPAPASSAEEQAAYAAAFDQLKAGRYDAAAKAFKDFLAAHPSGQYSDNAQYWLAETYYVTRKFKPALGEFRRLVEQFPGSQKLTGALLKIGYIHDELGDKAEARKVLQSLVKAHPDSTAAGLARKRLERLGGG
ncbi:MAG: tol-pal system protein YbgF [Ectothiorhodospiraceae bacterium]|nr:tol-pal system protein YbgF [Ectothiorhodospiraceae bacterium]